MKRVAVIADIHGNPQAFDAVAADIDSQGVDEVLVAGDLVGRGPFGGVVVERVLARGWRAIRGNHEDYLLNFRRQTVPARWLVTEEWAASRWMAAELDDAHVDYIDSLPMTMTSSTDPRLRLVHGSPAGYNDGLGPWSSDAELEAHLASVEEAVLVCAHTHRPMVRQLAGGLVVNVGSVGLPFNGDWRAQYAILTWDAAAERWEVDLRQVPYDRQDFLDAFVASGFLGEGMITAALLKREVEQSRPWLVPFLKWAGVIGEEPAEVLLEAFEQIYHPSMSMRTFFGMLAELERGER